MTPEEETLCGLLADLFQAPAGPRDSFVGLGGDSISAVHLVGAARRAGLRISVKDVLTQPDVAALAAAAQPMTRRAAAVTEAEDGVGAFRRTPIMHWLHERGGRSDAYYQYVVVRAPAGLTEESAAAVLQVLIDRHDALRLWITEAGPVTMPVGSVNAAACLTRVPAGVDADREAGVEPETGVEPEARTERGARVEREVHAARDRLAPGDGVVFQAVWFDAGPDTPGLLALVAHHLVIDGITWRVLTGDLDQAWRGRELAPVPVSFRRWSRLLHEESTRNRRMAELRYWSDVVRPGAARFGRRSLDPARDHEDRAEHLSRTLPARTTAPLLTSVPERLGADANEILLTALALALTEWLGDDADIVVDLEGHGREDEDADLSRTAGWFTTIYPARFRLDGLDPATVLDRVRAQLRAIPGKGLGYGLLRYLNASTRDILARADRPELGFNYLGRFPAATGADWQLLPEYGARLDAPGPGLPMAHAVELNAITLETPAGPVLYADWAWVPGVAADVERLADAWFRHLEGLVALADRQLSLSGIDQDELDDLTAALEAF